MADLPDEAEAEEVGEDLGDVVDDRGDSEERGRPAVVLHRDGHIDADVACELCNG